MANAVASKMLSTRDSVVRKNERANHPAVQSATEPEASDFECVTRTLEGDLEAFSKLVRRHEKMVFNLAFRFMRDWALAEDMAQESFLKAFRLLNGFRGECSFSSWLYSVTRSVCLTEISRRKRRGEVELKPSHEKATPTLPANLSDMPEMIRRCVSKLPEPYAAVITSYYLEETPYAEIAQTMKIPMGTLKVWMFRARAELRKIVESELGACAQD
jgi:RNA polymerase sigma-70 factor (ECF subfamily)